MSDKTDFPVRSLTQIAYAKEKLPFVRIAAKVGSEPFHDIGSGPSWKGAFESPSPRNLYPDLAHVRLFKEDFLGGAQLVQRMTLS